MYAKRSTSSGNGKLGTGNPLPCRLYLVRTNMAALEAVGDASDGCIREEILQKRQFRAAGVLIALGNGENGAIVFGDAEATVTQIGEVGQVPILIENAGD